MLRIGGSLMKKATHRLSRRYESSSNTERRSQSTNGRCCYYTWCTNEHSSPFAYRSTGVREMSGIFRRLDVDENGLPEGMKSPLSGSFDSSASPWKHESSPDSQPPWT